MGSISHIALSADTVETRPVYHIKVERQVQTVSIYVAVVQDFSTFVDLI